MKDKKQEGMLFRELSIDQSSIVQDKRTVELSFSSETPYQRYDFFEDAMYDEVLSHAETAINMTRLQQMGTVLFNHNSNSPIGGIERVWIEDGRGKAIVRFDDDADSDKIYQKVLKGSLKGVSVGYMIHEMEESKQGEVLTKTATNWEPLEISIVSVPADASVGVGRSMEEKKLEGGNDVMDGKKVVLEEVKEVKEIDVEKVKAETLKADRARVTEIRAMEEKFGIALADHIEAGTPVEEVRKIVLDGLAKKQDETKVSVSVAVDGAEKFRAAAIDAMLLRSGRKIDKPAEGAEELVGMSLKELMVESLRMRGEKTRGRFDELFSRAMGTSDFPNLLGAVANKAVIDGWNEEPSTWEAWAATGAVSNFQIHTGVRLGESDNLDLVAEGDEYNHGLRAETFEKYQVLTYGKKFVITRQGIINDELGLLTDIPASMGAAARRKVADVVYAAITSNPDMGDGIDLFHGTHKNFIASGASGNGAPGTATIGAAIKAMKLQKDATGKATLGISPQFLLAPVALEAATEQFFATTLIGGDAKNPNLANIYAGPRFTRIYEGRLDDALATGWYMAAAKGKTVKVFFLNGMQAPYLARQDGWDVDGVEYKVRIDCGAKAMDFRGLYYNYGA